MEVAVVVVLMAMEVPLIFALLECGGEPAAAGSASAVGQSGGAELKCVRGLCVVMGLAGP